jgi:acyl carrier protein
MYLMSYPIDTIISNLLAVSSNTAPPFVTAAIGSDFQWKILAWLGGITAFVSILHFYFLRLYEVLPQELKARRLIRLLDKQYFYAALRLRKWQQDLCQLSIKLGVVASLYCLTSAKPVWAVWLGLVVCLVFFCIVLRNTINALLNPRSTFNRKYLFYRKDPTFIRVRLSLEIVRHFIYILLAFTFASYGLHRLNGNGSMFQVDDSRISLFLTHLQSTVHSMTSLGNDTLACTSDGGVLFRVFTSLFAFIIVAPFIAILVSGFASAKRIEKNQRSRLTMAPLRLTEFGINNKLDLEAWLELEIEKQLEIHGRQINSNSNLMSDLGADSLDMLSIRVAAEEFLEIELEDSQLRSKLTVAQIADVFWQQLQTTTATTPERQRQK